ncbi:MAG: PQQ-like beta-propeller repeat protein, partial [Pirellulales bacterium]|nr:PQQ-like beta-propeller repeat protein [Pirellulales bacterium]
MTENAATDLPDADPPANGESDPKTSVSPSGPHWPPLIIMTVICGIVIACFQWLPGLYPGLRVVGTMVTAAILLILYFVWLYLLSGLKRKGRVAGTAIALVPIVVFFALRRIDGFDGDMAPITAWRWKPRPLEQLEKFVEENTASVDVSKLRTSSDVDYPAYLGRDRRAVVEGVELVTDWKANPPKELWRHPVGLAWSAFAVAGDFAVTQEQRSIEQPYEECVVAYELRTGKQIWVHTDAELFSQPEALGGDGPRATPTIDGERVYALGATGILNCLELKTGKRIWSTNILDDASADNIQWGMSGSPLIVDDLVVVSPGGDNGYAVIAYDKNDGKMVWHSGAKEETAGYSSPILTTIGGKQQIVLLSGLALSGYEPKTGEMLWHYPWDFADGQVIVCAQPLVPGDFGDKLADHVLMSCGYGVGGEMVKFDAGDQAPNRVWTTMQMKSKFANMVVVDEHIYGLSEGMLACVDLATG